MRQRKETGALEKRIIGKSDQNSSSGQSSRYSICPLFNHFYLTNCKR